MFSDMFVCFYVWRGMFFSENLRFKRRGKEEILVKARKENIYGDEREKKIRIHRDAFSVW